MLDIDLLTAAAPRTLGPGQLLVSLHQKEQRKLLGARWGNEDIVVELSSMTHFLPANCGYPAGYTISGARLQVDETKAILGNHDRPSGSLILIDGRVAIYLVEKLGDRLIAAVDHDEELSRVPNDNDLVFPSWRIVVGECGHEAELFSFGSTV